MHEIFFGGNERKLQRRHMYLPNAMGMFVGSRRIFLCQSVAKVGFPRVGMPLNNENIFTHETC
ncbi:MAG: hypothetical protein ACU84Q_09785 [Gammaproteobacteria bacterium]